MKKAFFVAALLAGTLTISIPLAAQEALKSSEEEYYDFLSLSGIVERPTLGYRTLSDSVWKFSTDTTTDSNDAPISFADTDANVWKNNNLGTTFTLWHPETASTNLYLSGVKQGLFCRIYGPEWYNSYNTAAPYGQNDGALWQGRGYNTSLTGGIRLEGYGLELTLKPQVCFQQNLEFDYITPNSAYTGNSTFVDKAGTYGYYGVAYIDAPQRFGNSPFWTFDWGDTEVRYTWKTFTAGFGTQAIWIGPAQLNPIMSSNNAASYPKLDVGIRRTSLFLPWLGWYLGDIEARGWWGYLSESKWFDNDDTNNHNLITGLSFSWGLPWIFKGITVGMNRTMLSKWDDISEYTLFKIYNPFLDQQNGNDNSDQRFSFIIDYLLPQSESEVYLEWARNDYSPMMDFIIRYPFHTQGWTVGGRKSFCLPFNIKAEINVELTDLECSADYDRLISWYSTFYAHHLITQGYTNDGQWLGAGMGTGGNSQYIDFKLLYPKGSTTFFFQRTNPDLDYTMYIDSKTTTNAESNIRVLLCYGCSSTYYVTKVLSVSEGFVYIDEHNPLNVVLEGSYSSVHRPNFHLTTSLKYSF